MTVSSRYDLPPGAETLGLTLYQLHAPTVAPCQRDAKPAGMMSSLGELTARPV